MYRFSRIPLIVPFIFLTGLIPGAEIQGRSAMPPNAEKISTTLVKRGVIPATASAAVREAATESYLKTKMRSGEMDKKANPKARRQLEANELAFNASGASINGRKLGNTVTVEPSTPQFKPLLGTGKLLVILVEFSTTPYTWQPAQGPQRTAAGPLHNQIPLPDNSFDLWVPDFDKVHYQNMLFTPGGWTIPAANPYYPNQKRGSMRDYFLEQSFGKYTVEGNAYGWFMLNKPEAYYGDDRPSGGSDNNLPGTTATLIADAVAVANSSGTPIPWGDYDTNGDCIIDHPLFIHAGIDQSGGGGAQGDDAIWAHSSSVWQQVTGPTAGCPGGIHIYNYTIMPEDGGVGVFAHEFGHDLGLPDEYDTAYSGRGESVAYWSLMSTGSWIGRPAQTQPANISIWGRYALGWAVPGDNAAVVNLTALSNEPITTRLEQAERWGGPGTTNAVRVNLPPKMTYVNTPHSGSWEWFGGKADQIDTTLTRTVDLTGKTNATLSFWTWYNIEPYWDFGFVQVSTDGGATWASLNIAGTTSTHDPGAMDSIVANLPGFTGSSGGWVFKTCSLSAYAGQIIQLRFRYMTDWGTTSDGFYVDDISVVANGSTLFTDNVETLDPAWTAAGWSRNPGARSTNHYYLLEWRNLNPMQTPYNGSTIVNFDAGLAKAYQYDPYGSTGNPNEPWYFPYTPGMLIWYRDMSYTDNWTGYHPGAGFLLVVDSHKQALLRPPYLNLGSLPWSTRVQSYDATFSLEPVPSTMLGYWGTAQLEPRENAIPNFDDNLGYWNALAPAASVKIPAYGLQIRVLGQASDGSAALVGLSRK